MLDDEGLRRLDRRLTELLSLLDRNPPNCDVETLVREIIQENEGTNPHGKLIRTGWEDFYRRHKGVASGWFLVPIPENATQEAADALRAESDARRAVFEAMVTWVNEKPQQDDREGLRKQVWRYLKSRGVDVPKSPAAEGQMQYVTLDQAAAMVNRSKRTLERRKTRTNNPLPPPDVQGGGGRPDEWFWLRIRPWLEQEYKKKLPEKFPAAFR
jgi:hypothetical protein